jgi:hypothetical protein
VLKRRISASLLLLFAIIDQSGGDGPSKTRVSKAVKPGKTISKPLLSTVPLVVSTWNIPKKAQVAPFAQESKLPPETFIAVPDTSNVEIASASARAGDNRMSGAASPGNANRLRNEHNQFFIVFPRLRMFRGTKLTQTRAAIKHQRTFWTA